MAIQEHIRRTNRLWYLGLWSAFAFFALSVVGLEFVTIVREGGARKPLGWSYVRVAGEWRVQSVDSPGPAAGLLRVGDRIAAIDGDRNAAKLGPRWYLRDSPDRDRYSLTVDRGGAELDQVIPWPVTYDNGERAWQWVHLASGVIYLAIGWLIAFARPDSKVARKVVLANMLTLGFWFTLVLETDTGIIGHVPLILALSYFFVRPFHLIAGYRFTRAFPLGDQSTPAWRRFDRIFMTAGFLIWVPSLYGAMLRSMGPARATAIAAAQFPFSLVHDSLVNSLFFLFAGVAGVANGLVAWRNYKLLPAGDLQRRLRWVSVGIVVGFLPIIIVAPLLFLKGLSGGAQRLALIVHIVNTVTVLLPVCIGYAVLKHRVLGIRVFTRTGVRHVLARNVLRLAVIAPVLLIAISIVRHPDRTIGELLLGPGGRWNIAMVILAALALKYRTVMVERIDRRFFREAYQQDQIFVALAEAIARVADIPELARLLSSQLQSALHPERVLALTRATGNALELVYSSGQSLTLKSLTDFGIPVDELMDVTGVEDTKNIPRLSADGHRVLDTLGIVLVVPIRGPNEGLVGLLLLGDKLSEEPYTRNDRRLLEATAAQTGIVWENLQLRQALSREQNVRRHLTARLDGGSAAIVMECPECGTCYDGDVIKCALDGRALSPSLPTTRVLDGKYRLNRLIGRGGMGAVYEATDLRLDRIVAVKAVMGSIFDDAIARQRFAREARASAKIVHPNVVGVFDIGEFDGGAYLVLEFLRGKTLRAKLDAGGGMEPRAAAQLLGNILDGVAAAHAQQVVHRDLKPENIFLTEDRNGQPGTAKILDFGLAIARDIEFTDENKLTRTGTAVGTLAYMSPEQFIGDPVDDRTDIHALGIIVLEMLTGSIELRGPFFARAEAILAERLSGEGHSPEERAVADVLRRAFTASKEDRYDSVEKFRADICGAIEQWAVSVQ
jgi:eukaryotic-like serine/threonine-protein kinase